MTDLEKISGWTEAEEIDGCGRERPPRVDRVFFLRRLKALDLGFLL